MCWDHVLVGLHFIRWIAIYPLGRVIYLLFDRNKLFSFFFSFLAGAKPVFPGKDDKDKPKFALKGSKDKSKYPFTSLPCSLDRCEC